MTGIIINEEGQKEYKVSKKLIDPQTMEFATSISSNIYEGCGIAILISDSVDIGVLMKAIGKLSKLVESEWEGRDRI